MKGLFAVGPGDLTGAGERFRGRFFGKGGTVSALLAWRASDLATWAL
jgi:hypothetical protein